jgi:signal transduction histidine kinase
VPRGITVNASSFAGRLGKAVAAPVVLGSLLCAATATLVWLGYRATVEWQRSDAQAAARRVSETLAFVSGALNRDMKGAHASILSTVHSSQLLFDAPYDIADEFGQAFARFPYPESFFIWTPRRPMAGGAIFFNRADRRPPWWPSESILTAYPVLVRDAPPAADPLLEMVRRMATPRRPFVAEHTMLGSTSYQVVAQVIYSGDSGVDLAGMVGYTVNLDWVRQSYFSELLRQITGITDDDGAMSISVLDERQQLVAATNPRLHHDVMSEREFPLWFFDQALGGEASRPAAPLWTVRVAAALDDSAGGADTARRMLLLMALAAGAVLAALFAIVRAARSSAKLAALKSEFVSTVTHEIKTPVAGIQLVAETLASGRCTSPATVREYGTLLSLESRRLTQLIENLLAFARLSDVERSYVFEAVEPGELIDEALQRCGLRIAELGFTIEHALPAELPRVRADRAAIVQVIENIIDNALNYSDGNRSIEIAGARGAASVRLAIRDRGRGISLEDLPHVFDKFFRGRHSHTGGSGLGLTIAHRIARDHQGDLEIDSVSDEGTTVTLVLPIVA